MIKHNNHSRGLNVVGRPRRGLTLLEVIVSTLIVGLMTVASLNSLGAATRSAMSIGDRAIALGLADDLMAEILPLAYSDPNTTPTFGPEGAESSGPRNVFDDVDDFHGWNESPPKNRDGVTIPNRDDWRHKVQVVRVTPANPTLATGGPDQGAKRIQVTIEYRGQVLAEQFAVRTNLD
jgi:prepilin-type N-terminal cleavage/methylation domain-containing protein